MKSYKNYSLYFAVFSFGLASMTGQILLLRELIVVFYGNELSVGIMLASWLFWVAIGSWGINSISHFIEKRLKIDAPPYLLFSSLLIAVSIVLPLSIILLRNIKNFLNVSTGEIIGLIPISVSSFLALAPAALLFGFLFSLSCRIASYKSGRALVDVGIVYIVEAFGACAGGLAFNYLLIPIAKPLQIALLCGVLNIFAFLFLIDIRQRPLRWGAAGSFMLLILLSFMYVANPLDFRMRQMQWRNFELMDNRDSVYGNIALTKLDSQLNLFENGLLISSTQDPLTAEEAVHYALLEHPNPKRVLLIGGSLNGSLEEVLKYPVEKIDYVELDPAIMKVAKDNYPKDLLKALEDTRIAFHHIDGRLFVKKISAKKSIKYDVLILILPNPFTAQLNRFYSSEFYREVKSILSEEGILSFGIASSENYINPQQGQFLGCLYRTLEDEFQDIKILPGDYNFFLASPAKGVLTYDPKILLERLKERNLDLKYVREYYLPFKLNQQRVKYLEDAIKGAPGTKVNYDFRPIGYFYDMVLWVTHFKSDIKDFLERLERITPKAVALLLSCAFIFLSIFQFANKRFATLATYISIGTTGFSEMLFQVVVILSFQIIYGYVYYKIGLIFAFFMLGLILGSALAIRILAKGKRLPRLYLSTQLAICAYPFILPPTFLFLSRAPADIAHSFAVETLFSSLPVVAGFIGGLQFPLANKICLGQKGYVAKTAGLLYGIDLLGACLGALLTSAILIPIIGINAACYLAGLMNFFVLLLLIVAYFRWEYKR